MFRLLLFAIFALGYTQSLFAQKSTQDLLDSLTVELAKTNNDTDKVKILVKISVYKSVLVNHAEGIKYAERAYELAKKQNWSKGVALANTYIGKIYNHDFKLDKAMEHYVAAEKIYEESGNDLDLSEVLDQMAIAYSRVHDYPKALEYYLKRLAVCERLADKDEIASVNVGISFMFENSGDYQNALHHYRVALSLYQQTNNEQRAGTVTGYIGDIHRKTQNYDSAIVSFRMQLKIAEKRNDTNQIASSAYNIGMVYIDKKQPDTALVYFQRSLELYEATKHFNGISNNLGNIASIYTEKTMYGSAYELRLKCLAIDKKWDERRAIAPTLLEIARLLLKSATHKHKIVNDIPIKNKIPLSIAYAQEALFIAKGAQMLHLTRNCYITLAEAYTLQGNYKIALRYKDSLIAVKDSIANRKEGESIVKLGMQGEFRRRRMADSLETLRQTTEGAAKLKRQRYYTYSGISVALLLLALSYFAIAERKKSEKLLLNIIPSEVAAELKKKGELSAKMFDNVTVLFTDFENFTKTSEKLTPQQLVDELHACFTAFDKIMAKYGIEKIKTVGDAYLAVSGLPLADKHHAENVVNAAIEIRNFITSRKQDLGDNGFNIRIGINSGNVVAGIVGVKKFAYDIWGDTVNTAARMEQNSEGGKINISQTTYDLIKDKFKCTYRGEIEAKNKGMMAMYFVDDAII